MKVIGEEVMVVEKRSFTSKKSNTTFYKLTMGNSEGGLVQVSCSMDVYDSVIPFDEKYDVEIDINSNGYNIYADLIRIFAK